MSRCWRFRVSGQVQGVFFRAATRDQARRLGLDGWVRNLAGGVELLACGDEAAVDRLQVWLWEGPPLARVAQVAREEAADPPTEGFHVKY